jgi:hypothetical protein
VPRLRTRDVEHFSLVVAVSSACSAALSRYSSERPLKLQIQYSGFQLSRRSARLGRAIIAGIMREESKQHSAKLSDGNYLFRVWLKLKTRAQSEVKGMEMSNQPENVVANKPKCVGSIRDNIVKSDAAESNVVS